MEKTSQRPSKEATRYPKWEKWERPRSLRQGYPPEGRMEQEPRENETEMETPCHPQHRAEATKSIDVYRTQSWKKFVDE